MMKLASIPLALASLALVTPAHASVKGWQDASDVAVYSLMAIAVAKPLIDKDKHGALQATGSIAATSLVTEGLKEAFPKLRPDGSDRKSFPSGHTSRAFSSAATIWNRHGKSWGIPAMAVAGFTGLARVEGKKHYWSDVAVGAALGTAMGFLITNKPPREDRAMIIPWADTKGGGVSVSLRF